jgi:hypothetical protein
MAEKQVDVYIDVEPVLHKMAFASHFVSYQLRYSSGQFTPNMDPEVTPVSTLKIFEISTVLPLCTSIDPSIHPRSTRLLVIYLLAP